MTNKLHIELPVSIDKTKSFIEWCKFINNVCKFKERRQVFLSGKLISDNYIFIVEA